MFYSSHLCVGLMKTVIFLGAWLIFRNKNNLNEPLAIRVFLEHRYQSFSHFSSDLFNYFRAETVYCLVPVNSSWCRNISVEMLYSSLLYVVFIIKIPISSNPCVTCGSSKLMCSLDVFVYSRFSLSPRVSPRWWLYSPIYRVENATNFIVPLSNCGSVVPYRCFE